MFLVECNYMTLGFNKPHKVVVHPQLPKAHIDEEVGGLLFRLHIAVQAAARKEL